jgi:hypothetical protein
VAKGAGKARGLRTGRNFGVQPWVQFLNEAVVRGVKPQLPPSCIGGAPAQGVSQPASAHSPGRTQARLRSPGWHVPRTPASRDGEMATAHHPLTDSAAS